MLFTIEMIFALLFLPSIEQRLCRVKGILPCGISFAEVLGQMYWDHMPEKTGSVCFAKPVSLQQTPSPMTINPLQKS